MSEVFARGAMRLCFGVVSTILAAVCASPSHPVPPLKELFSRPLIWGTSPTELAWAKKAHILVFLWNPDGKRFRDLYAYNADTGTLARLTDLEQQKDDLNRSEDEKDERLKRYLAPPSGLASFDVAQDGTKVAFAYKGDLYTVDTNGKTPPLRLTRTKAAESSPQLSPDGKQLASIRAGQVIVQSLTTGQIWQATDVESGTLLSYRWSPDGTRFSFGVRNGSPRMLPITNYSGRFATTRTIPRSVAGDELSESKYSIVPVEGGPAKSIELTPGGKGASTVPVWSPDSKKLLAMVSAPDWKKKTILVIDAATGKSKSLYEETDNRWVDYGSASWSPDSQSVLFTSEADGWAHLHVVPAAGGAKAVQITRGPYEVHKETFSENPQWIVGHIYFASTEGDTAQRHVYRIRPDGSGKEKLSSREGLNIPLVSEDGMFMAVMRADGDNPLDLWVGEKRVTTSPRPEFYQIKWPETRYVRYPSREDKQPVAARLMLPPGYVPNARGGPKFPAVVYVHGSGYATSVLKQWGSYVEYRYAFNAFLASRGYVILEMDYRGSTGYGRDWRSGVYLDMGGPDLEDVLGGVDYLRSLGNIDMNRIGIWGVSYGGFMTDMALFRAPGVFKAGSAWAAVNDWENYNAGYTPQRLNTPDKNPEAYRRSSPIWFSNNLQDHLLIVHGMVDDNVLFQDAVQLTEKLIHEGKQFDHIFYPEESHGFVRDETWIDALRRTTEWFDRWLK